MSIDRQVSSKGKISINLLPPEVIFQRKQSSKLSLVSKMSIAMLVVLIFFTSATFALRISQRSQLQEAQQGLVSAQEKVSRLQGKGAQVAALKQRLSSIQTLMGSPSKTQKVFNVIAPLLPADINASELAIDEKGNIDMLASSPSIVSINNLISDLSNKDKTSNLISRIDLTSLSAGKDSVYRFGLKMIAKD